MLTGQLFKCLRDSLFDLVSLNFSYTWSKWEVSQVSSYSNPSRNDSCGIFLRERWAFKLLVIHVTNMLSIFLVTMIFLDDFIKKITESSVRVM